MRQRMAALSPLRTQAAHRMQRLRLAPRLEAQAPAGLRLLPERPLAAREPVSRASTPRRLASAVRPHVLSSRPAAARWVSVAPLSAVRRPSAVRPLVFLQPALAVQGLPVHRGLIWQRAAAQRLSVQRFSAAPRPSSDRELAAVRVLWSLLYAPHAEPKPLAGLVQVPVMVPACFATIGPVAKLRVAAVQADQWRCRHHAPLPWPPSRL